MFLEAVFFLKHHCKGRYKCAACTDHPALPPGPAAQAGLHCPSTITGNRTHQHQLITPLHYTDELDWSQSIALMKCHLLKRHRLSKAGDAGPGSCSSGTSRHQIVHVPLWLMPEPRWGQAEHHHAATTMMLQKSKLWPCSLFKMQLCKGHRGGDETRSCNKEGEIKNNDRNKLS